MPKGAKAQHAKKKQGKSHPTGKPKGLNLSKIGRALGNFVSPGFGTVASMAGKAIDRVLGHGDYNVKGNTIMSNQAPQFASTGTGMRIAHREFVCDVHSTTDFSTRDYLINPGNKYLFPWLSSIANSFEEYELKGMLITYKPTSGTAISSNSAAMGSVILSTEYDVLKPTFSSKQEMEAYQYTTPTVPYSACIHPVECAPSMTVLPKKYVTNKSQISELTQDDDPRLHYLGRFVYATAFQQTNASALGELWVSYDVVFYKPRLPPNSSLLNTSYTLSMVAADWADGYSPSPILDSSSTIKSSQNVTIDDYQDTATHWSVRATFVTPGRYLCLCAVDQAAGGSQIGFSSGWYTDGSAVMVNSFSDDLGSAASNGPVFLTDHYVRGTSGGFNDFGSIFVAVVDSPSVNGKFTFPAPTKATALVKGHITYHVGLLGPAGDSLQCPAPPRLLRQQGYYRQPIQDTSCAAAAAASSSSTVTDTSNEEDLPGFQESDLRQFLKSLNIACKNAIDSKDPKDSEFARDSLNFITTTMILLADHRLTAREIVKLCTRTIQKIDRLTPFEE